MRIITTITAFIVTFAKFNFAAFSISLFTTKYFVPYNKFVTQQIEKKSQTLKPLYQPINHESVRKFFLGVIKNETDTIIKMMVWGL